MAIEKNAIRMRRNGKVKTNNKLLMYSIASFISTEVNYIMNTILNCSKYLKNCSFERKI